MSIQRGLISHAHQVQLLNLGLFIGHVDQLAESSVSKAECSRFKSGRGYWKRSCDMPSWGNMVDPSVREADSFAESRFESG